MTWIEEFERKFPDVSKNAAAEDLESLGLALGFDSRGTDAEDHPTKADREALLNASYGSWLDAQVVTSDDSIGMPPPRFVEFLDVKQSSLWRVVALLQRERPEWGFDVHKERRLLPELLFVSQLSRLLLSAALVEERAGHHGRANDLLDGGWALSQSIAWRPELICQLIGVATVRSLAGAMRKLSEPLPEWIERMESTRPLEKVSESLHNDSLISRLQRGPVEGDSSDSLWSRVTAVMTDLVKERTACEVSTFSSDRIWGPAIEEVSRSATDAERLQLQLISEDSTPNLTSALHRAARLVVESELTARILQLRLERAAARPSRWPDKLYDADSRACSEAVYEYRSAGGGMTIRFKGAVGDLEPPAKPLPLFFEARAPKPSPTSTPTRRASPTPTPMPRPSLTPRKAGA